MQLGVWLWAIGKTGGVFSFCDDDFSEVLIGSFSGDDQTGIRSQNKIYDWFHGAERSRVVCFDWQVENNSVRLSLELGLFQKRLPAGRFAVAGFSLGALTDEFIERRIGLRIVDPMGYAIKSKSIFLQNGIKSKAMLLGESFEKSSFAWQGHGVGKQDAAFQKV